MATFDDPFDSATRLDRCSCGGHGSQAEHDKAAALDEETRLTRVVDQAVLRAIYPEDATRRTLLKAVGAGARRRRSRNSSRWAWRARLSRPRVRSRRRI